MKKWRQVLAGEKSEPKLMVGFKRYKTDNDVELPNAAEFSGDKDPSKTGDSAKKELEAFKEGNKLMQSDKKREDKTKGTSALMSEDAKRKDMAKHISEEKDHVKPSYAGKAIGLRSKGGPNLKPISDTEYTPSQEDRNMDSESSDWFDKISGDAMRLEKEFKSSGNGGPEQITSKIEILKELLPLYKELQKNYYQYISEHQKSITPQEVSPESENTPSTWASLKKGWRNVLADVSFKNKPDGTVQIDITSHPNEPLVQNPITQQPGAMSPEDVQQQEQQTGTSAEASLNKESFVQPGQRVKHINSGVTGVVEKIEGKDLYVKTDSGSTAIWGFNEINIATSNQTPAQNISQYFASAKKWDIKKEGNLTLIGAECEKCAGIQIEKDGKAVESYMVNKDNHEWREVVNEAVWVSKFEEHLK